MGQKTNASIFRLSLKNSEWNSKYIEKNREESTLYLYKNVEIQDYIDTIFQHYNFLIHSCNIEYNYNNANILILYYELKTVKPVIKENDYNKFKQNNKNTHLFLIKNIITPSLNLYIKNKVINVKIVNLNKKFEFNVKKKNLNEYKKTLKLFKKFFKTPWQKDLIKLLFISSCEKNSSKLISDSISFCLKKYPKRHNYLLFLIKKTFNILLKLSFVKIKGIKIAISGRFNGAPRAKKKILKQGIVPLQSLNSNINYHNSTSYTSNGTFGVKVWVCGKTLILYVFTTEKIKI